MCWLYAPWRYTSLCFSPQHNSKYIVGSTNHSLFNYPSIFTRCLQCARNCTRLWDTKDINQNSRNSFSTWEINKLNSTCRKIWKYNNRGIKQVPSGSFYSNLERTSELTNHFLSSICTVTTGYWECVDHHHAVGIRWSHTNCSPLL